MNYVKRALVSVNRQRGKTTILLLLVFLLGNLMSGAISIRTAIQNTDSNLRSRLPAVATLDFDTMSAFSSFEYTGIWPDDELTADYIHQVAELPYVREFIYFLNWDFHNRDLERYFNPFYYDAEHAWIRTNFRDHHTLRPYGADFESFAFMGTNVVEPLEFHLGLIELVEGRLLTEEEIRNGEAVALISRGFAQMNNLLIGSTVPMLNGWFHWYHEDNMLWQESFTEENLLASQEIPVQIVGIFDLDGVWDIEDILNLNEVKMQLENRFYVPNALIAEASSFWLEHSEHNVEFLPQAFFYLENPMYLRAFAEAATDILPGFHQITDLSHTFMDMAGSMEFLLMLADLILGGAISATLIIVSLLIMLFLRDRKHEIGIYIALGEQKVKILFQIWIEVLSITAFAIVLSLFTGSIFSNSLSRQLLENDLNQRQAQRWTTGTYSTQGMQLLRMFSPGEMDLQDFMEAYDTSMNVQTLTLFFGISLITILVSTLLPIIYAMNLKPKKILL